jgi:hypothetical protein
VSGAGGVWLLAEVLPASLRHVDAVVLCGGLDVGEGLFALVVCDILDLIEAGDGVADMGGVVQRLLALVGEGIDGCGELAALLRVEGFIVFVVLPGCFHHGSNLVFTLRWVQWRYARLDVVRRLNVVNEGPICVARGMLLGL